MKKQLFVSAIMCFSMLNVWSQSITIEDVAGKRFNGVKSIISPLDNSSAGFFTYYQIEKGAKGMRTYQFAFVDPAVTKKTTTNIEMRKDVDINLTIFNGKFLLVSYEDWKNKVNVFKLIDKNGKITKSKEIPIDKKTYRASSVFPASDGEGFYFITSEDPKKAGVGYEIQRLNNNLDIVWAVTETTTKGIKSINDLVSSNGKLILWQEYNVKNKIKPSVLCLDEKTGKKIFERDGYDGESTILPNQVKVDDKGNVILGGPYVNGEKIDWINNDGIYILKLDANGKEILYTKVDNKEKIQKALKSASTGFTVGSKDKVYVQDLIVNGDEIIVVTEMFRLNLNITPKTVQVGRDLITGKFAGYVGGVDGNESKYVFEIMDYMLFKFNATGEMTEIKQIPKDDYNKITVWYPYNMMTGVPLAKAMDEIGWFDYGFQTVNSKGELIMVCSNNTKPRLPEVYTYDLNNSYAQSKINLKQEAKIDLDKAKVGYFRSLKATSGNIAAVYYQKKLDKITINLESIE